MEVDSLVQAEVKQIQQFVNNVNIVQDLVNQLGTTRDSKELRNQLEEKREETKELEKSISYKIESRSNNKNNSHHSNGKNNNTSSNGATLSFQHPLYQHLILQFNQIRELWKNLYKDSYVKEAFAKASPTASSTPPSAAAASRGTEKLKPPSRVNQSPLPSSQQGIHFE